MNVQPGSYYGFMDQRQAELQQKAFQNAGMNAYLQLQSLSNAMPSLVGTENAIRDPYRMSYYEQRWSIGRVWDDMQ